MNHNSQGILQQLLSLCLIVESYQVEIPPQQESLPEEELQEIIEEEEKETIEQCIQDEERHESDKEYLTEEQNELYEYKPLSSDNSYVFEEDNPGIVYIGRFENDPVGASEKMADVAMIKMLGRMALVGIR